MEIQKIHGLKQECQGVSWKLCPGIIEMLQKVLYSFAKELPNSLSNFQMLLSMLISNMTLFVFDILHDIKLIYTTITHFKQF